MTHYRLSSRTRYYSIINLNTEYSYATNLYLSYSSLILNANKHKLNVFLNKVSSYTQIGLKTNLTFKIKKLEEDFIPEIIYMLKNSHNEQLDERFFIYVVDKLGKDINELPSDLKIMISSYLAEVKYKFDNNYIIKNLNSSMFSFGAWLEASALVNSNTLEEAGRYIADYLSNKNSIKDQDKYVIGLSSSEYILKSFNSEEILKEFKKQKKDTYQFLLSLNTQHFK